MEFYKRLASTLAQQFGNNCEIVVHDLSGEDMDHTIAVIENGHVIVKLSDYYRPKKEYEIQYENRK